MVKVLPEKPRKIERYFVLWVLEDDPTNLLNESPFIKDEGFVEYIGNPLIVKGKMVGVLEVFQQDTIKY